MSDSSALTTASASCANHASGDSAALDGCTAVVAMARSYVGADFRPTFHAGFGWGMMGVVTALRWEWRTFGDHFATAEKRFDLLKPESVADTDETYLLSARSVDAVKVRGGLMDVKRLEQVDDDGLELWKPLM